MLRCSISSVRRLEGDVLHPIVGADGVHRFAPTELARVASHRLARPVEGSKEGERDAQVFEALEEGKGLREIVTTLRLPADLAARLHASWLKMGSQQDMILSSERLRQLRSALHMDVKRPVDLVDEVQWLAEQCNVLEVERNKLDNELGDLLCAIGKTAANDPDVAKALPGLSSTLAPIWPTGSPRRSSTSRTSERARRTAHQRQRAKMRALRRGHDRLASPRHRIELAPNGSVGRVPGGSRSWR